MDRTGYLFNGFGDHLSAEKMTGCVLRAACGGLWGAGKSISQSVLIGYTVYQRDALCAMRYAANHMLFDACLEGQPTVAAGIRSARWPTLLPSFPRRRESSRGILYGPPAIWREWRLVFTQRLMTHRSLI